MILPFADRIPAVDPSAVVFSSATVVGAVTLGPGSSVWFGSILRADVDDIWIGARTNVQDRSVIHVTTKRFSTRLGDDVTVGHHVVVHGCTIGNRVLVGIGAIVLNGVVIEDEVFIAAGTLLTPGTQIPSGSMVMGSPGKVKRPLTDAERAALVPHAAGYVLNAKLHRGG